jgi:hypothetical protein
MPSLDAYRWLIGDEAAHWLKKVAEDLAGRPALPATVKSLRTVLGAERAVLVWGQIELRAKARAKFSRADELFFTARGLEQATDEILAGYKAQRFAELGNVADLCCGIGGDAMALCQEHAVELIDRDETSLLLAAANIERMGGTLASQTASTVGPEQVAGTMAWHIDPDRRPAGVRTSRVELGDPGVEVIDALLARCCDAGVKVAPAADLPAHWLDRCQREWIQTRGECRQQVAWFGRLAEEQGQRTATLVDANGEACSFSGTGEVSPGFADELGEYLFDPSPSLCAAGLVGVLAEVCGLGVLSPQSSYLTGDQAVVHPHLQAFAVEQELPLDVRQLRSYLHANKIGRLEIKKKGVDMTPETLRPQLKLAGDAEATLVLAQSAGQVRAMVCRRA